MTPLPGVRSNTLDLELRFNWSGTTLGKIPTTPHLQVGVAVLVGNTSHSGGVPERAGIDDAEEETSQIIEKHL